MTEELNLDDVLNDAESLRALPRDAQLSKLTDLCLSQLKLEEAVIDMEAALAQARENLRQTSEISIPTLMTELGLQSITLNNGKVVSIKPYVSAKSTPQVVEWLSQNGYDEVIKGTLKAVFPKGYPHDALARIKDYMGKEGLAAEAETTVHYQTLVAWVKDAMQKGINFPRDLFQVFQGYKTTIK